MQIRSKTGSKLGQTGTHVPQNSDSKEGYLDGQDRQPPPIASDFGSQTQIAALFAILTYQTVELRIANRTFRIAAQIARVSRARKP